MSKEQIYKQQMTELGIYHEIFDPEIKTLSQLERQLTRAEKEWSATAPPDGKPSFTSPVFAVIQKLRAEVLQHREALGLTPKAMAKLTRGNGANEPTSKDLITSKLDQIVARVSEYDDGAPAKVNPDWWKYDEAGAPVGFPDGPFYNRSIMGAAQCASEDSFDETDADAFSGIPAAEDAKRGADLIDEELRQAVHEDMG